MATFSCIITAAGSGIRFDQKQKKQFYELNGLPILHYSLRFFSKMRSVSEIILTLPAEDLDEQSITLMDEFPKISFIVEGGDNRQKSVCNALEQCNDTDFVIIHDAVRPFIDRNELKEMMSLVQKYNAVVPGAKVKNTIKRVYRDDVCETLLRKGLIEVYTPQIFKLDLIKECHILASETDIVFTDDASILEYYYESVKWYETKSPNLKITTKDDLLFAEYLLNNTKIFLTTE